jgi:capsular polysaccharide biosynthesis protein
VKPNKAKIGVVALLIGIMMGVGLAFFSEYMDSSLKTIEDVQECLGIPVLGTIPKMVSGGSRWKK